MSSENAYVDFFTDSSNMTELIMRMDAVDRILAYNKEMLDTLDRSIVELEQKQVELKKYEEELENNIASYEQKIKELDSRYLALMDDGIDINEEIYNIKETIN
jgi:peptidoglycan hydrolase CwlO-like protein